MDLPLLLPPCPHFVLHPAPALLPPLQRPQEAQTFWPHIVTGTLAFSTLSPRNVLELGPGFILFPPWSRTGA